MVHSRADFFRLTAEDLETLDRLREEERREPRRPDRPGARRPTAGAVLNGLGMPQVGGRRPSTWPTGWPSGSDPTTTRRPTATSCRIRGSRRSRRSCAGSAPRSPTRSPRSPGSGRRSRRRSVAGSRTRRRATCCASWWTSASCPNGPCVRPAGEGSAGPLEGKTLVVTGTLEGFTPPRGRGGDPRRGRQAGRLGLQEDRLRRRGRERRLEAGQGAGAGRADPRRGWVPPGPGRRRRVTASR